MGLQKFDEFKLNLNVKRATVIEKLKINDFYGFLGIQLNLKAFPFTSDFNSLNEFVQLYNFPSIYFKLSS